MPILLDERALAQKLPAMLEGQDVMLAVAFWGAGATENLCLSSVKTAKIICNIESGCCNPEEINRLRQLHPRIELKTLNSLHSKVYLAENVAVIGSSNASSNGLVFDTDSTGWREMNVEVQDISVVGNLKKWFESQWNEASSDIDAALKIGAKRRSAHGRLSRELSLEGSSFLEALEKEANLFGNVYFAMFYDQTPEHAHRAAKTNFGNALPEDYWLYDYFDVIHADSWFIDVHIRAEPEICGFSRTYKTPHSFEHPQRKYKIWVAHQDDDSITLKSGGKIPLPEEDKIIIAKYANKLWDLGKGNADCRLVPVKNILPFLKRGGE